MNRRILCLYLPNWPIQRLAGHNSTLRRPALRLPQHSTLPILLYSRDPRRGDLVIVCNDIALERGVRLGMPLAEAAALAEHGVTCRVGCAHQDRSLGAQSRRVGPATGTDAKRWSAIAGQPMIQPHDRAADLAELARLAERCERFSPIVGWETAETFKFQVPGFKPGASPTWNTKLGTWNGLGPDCLFLDVTGIGVLFGGEEKLADAVVAECAQIDYQAQVAVADTIGASWALATQESSKFQVSSSKLEKEPTLLSTQYTVLSTKFASLPLDCLRLPAETVELLSQLGISKLDQLLTLPRETLRARFGERLLLRVDQLLGAAQEIIVPHRPPPQFVEEWVLEYPAERRDVIEQVLRELVRRIAIALANRREGVLKLNSRFDCAPGQPVVLDIGLFRPSADEKHLWDLVTMQLEQAALPGPIGRVRLEAALTASLENRQGELFAGNQHEAERQLALLIDRCSSRLGPTAVLRPQLTADPLPERAVKYTKGVRSQRAEVKRARSGQQGGRNEHSSALRAPHSALQRPLFLHSPPRALEVMSVAPDGPPVSFGLQGEKHEVVAQAGPERIEAGWWRGTTVRRDYWRVTTANGQRFWLFRNLSDQNWYLHGEFS